MIRRTAIDGGDYVLYTDHLAAIEEKDKEIEQLEAENDNMRKIFDGLMAILPPEYFVKEDSAGYR